MFLFQLALNRLFRKSTRVRIVRGGTRAGKALGNEVLYEATGSELAGLRKELRVLIVTPLRCLCDGSYAIEFWNESRLVNTVGYHHHRTLRHPSFPTDAVLLHRGGLANWLSARGVSELLDEIDEDRRAEIRRKHSRKVWKASAPASLRSFLWLFEQNAFLATAAVDLSYENETLACKELLEWLGNASGPWSGYPGYESLPLEILERFPEKILKSTLLENLDNRTLLLGAARLLGTHRSYIAEKPVLKQLPDSVWEKFLQVVSEQGIDDNVERLKLVMETVNGEHPT